MINENYTPFDPRVYLFLMFASIVAGLTIYSEMALFLVFVHSAIWLIVGLKGEKLLSYIISYFIVFLVTRICVYFLSIDATNMYAIFFSNFGTIGRKAFPSFIFAIIIAKQPTGSLLASLYALKVPKAIGIGLATMLRFPATFSDEYKHIRNAEKFRGIGVGFWHTLAHLPSVLGNVYIPLIIRITKISEELAASVTVRGVRFHNEVVSFKDTSFRKKDSIALAVSLVIIMLFFALDKIIMEVI